MMSENRKQLVLAIGSLVVIIASSCWLASSFLRPKFNTKLHQGIGEVMAEETAKLLNGKGKVVVIIQDPKAAPVLQAQLKAFQRMIGRKDILLADTVVVRAAQRKLGPGMGLSVDQFLTVLEKHRQADAIVSFIGTPAPADPKIVALGKIEGPKIIAETRNRSNLKPLFRNQLLHAAIVPRFDFPAPGSKNPSTPREWFDLSYQVVRH